VHKIIQIPNVSTDVKDNTMRRSACILLVTLLALSVGLAAAEVNVKLANANFKAPSPEKENLNGEWVEPDRPG
jgi:hypothetical protein